MNKITPQIAVQILRSQQISQGRIVADLDAVGVKTTQETISRIGSGAIKNPSFALGAALVELAASADASSEAA